MDVSNYVSNFNTVTPALRIHCVPNPWVPSHYHYLVRAGAACQTRAYQAPAQNHQLGAPLRCRSFDHSFFVRNKTGFFLASPIPPSLISCAPQLRGHACCAVVAHSKTRWIHPAATRPSPYLFPQSGSSPPPTGCWLPGFRAPPPPQRPRVPRARFHEHDELGFGVSKRRTAHPPRPRSLFLPISLAPCRRGGRQDARAEAHLLGLD